MSRSFFLALGLAAAALAAVPSAQAQPSSGGACLNLQSQEGQQLADARTLYIRASGKTYRLGFAHDCSSAPNETLILHPFANDPRICKPIELNVSVAATGERCIVDSLTELTPDEVAALPKKFRP
jgi:hypothetical protein